MKRWASLVINDCILELAKIIIHGYLYSWLVLQLFIWLPLNFSGLNLLKSDNDKCK